MSYKYPYSIVDQALRNFLVFVLLLLAVVAVAAAIGTVSGVDTSATDAQTMGVPVGVQGSVPAHAWEDIEQHAPTISTSLAHVDSNENQEWDFYDE